MPSPKPVVYHVLFHSPGPNWVRGKAFREQPGVMDHVQYCAGLLQKGVVIEGGPFLDDSGGMMVLNSESAEAAQTIADADPTVKGGLLRVTVRPWMVAMKQ